MAEGICKILGGSTPPTAQNKQLKTINMSMNKLLKKTTLPLDGKRAVIIAVESTDVRVIPALIRYSAGRNYWCILSNDRAYDGSYPWDVIKREFNYGWCVHMSMQEKFLPISNIEKLIGGANDQITGEDAERIARSLVTTDPWHLQSFISGFALVVDRYALIETDTIIGRTQHTLQKCFNTLCMYRSGITLFNYKSMTL